MGTTIGDLLESVLTETASSSPAGIRFLTGFHHAKTHTYRELTHQAMRVAACLRARGILPGHRVAILSGTHPDFYAGFFGAILAGAVPCALYPPLRLGRLDEWKAQTLGSLKSIQANHVLVERRFAGVLHRVVANEVLPVTILDVASQHETALFDPHDDPDSQAVIQLSSGTTGTPKPVVLTHRNILRNLSDIRTILPITPGKPPSGVSWLPLYHDMGLFGKLFMGLLTQGPLTLIPPDLFLAKPIIWLEELHRSRATISAAPNFAFGVCVKRIEDFSHLDLSDWKMAICGAETVHNHTFAAFARKFASVGFDATIFSPAYGLAESTLALTCVPATRKPVWTKFSREALTRMGRAEVSPQADDGSLEIASLGKPLPSVSLRIVNDDDEEVQERHVGRILAKGPNIAGATRADGWFETGDVGFLYQGELHFIGRAKDIVIVNGRNFDPAVFEVAAQRVDGIRQGCVACFSCAFGDEDTEGLVVLAEREKNATRPKEDLEAELALVIRRDLQITAKVCRVLEPGVLPRTSSGKMRRAEAKRLWREDHLTAPKRFGVYRYLVDSQLGKLSAWQRRGKTSDAERG